MIYWLSALKWGGFEDSGHRIKEGLLRIMEQESHRNPPAFLWVLHAPWYQSSPVLPEKSMLEFNYNIKG